MENVIYIGAGMPKEGVMRNELFTARPTNLIARLSEKYPLISLLFVPVTELATASEQIQQVGSALAQAYAQTKRGGVN